MLLIALACGKRSSERYQEHFEDGNLGQLNPMRRAMVAEGVAGIPLLDLSEPLSRGICRNPRLVGLTSGENRPDDAGELCWRAPVVTVVTELSAPVMIP